MSEEGNKVWSLTPVPTFFLVLLLSFSLKNLADSLSIFPRTRSLTMKTSSSVNVISGEKSQVLGPYWAKRQVLNIPSSGTSSSDNEDQNVDQELRKKISVLYVEHIKDDGTGVNYKALGESDTFKDYVSATSKLQSIDLTAMENNAKKAFFLNVYNSLIIHAMTQLGAPTNLLGRLRLYATASYRFCLGGGQTVDLALNDIENGILRGNRPAASPMSRVPFREGDGRLGLVQACDPRIHFALNCGALSCPPIRFYDPEELDEQLDLAARSFMNEVEVDLEKGEVKLSKLLDWYKEDFGSSPEAVLSWVAKYAPEEEKQMIEDSMKSDKKLKIVYNPYDWGLNQS